MTAVAVAGDTRPPHLWGAQHGARTWQVTGWQCCLSATLRFKEAERGFWLHLRMRCIHTGKGGLGVGRGCRQGSYFGTPLKAWSFSTRPWSVSRTGLRLLWRHHPKSPLPQPACKGGSCFGLRAPVYHPGERLRPWGRWHPAACRCWAGPVLRAPPPAPGQRAAGGPRPPGGPGSARKPKVPSCPVLGSA